MVVKFLDPKNDVAFRKVFGSEKNKEILIHFLNDMLTFKERAPIKEVTFLKTIQDPETAAKKTSIVDILCKDEKDNHYIVEMQVAKGKGFEKRAQYYAAKAFVSQMEVGGTYENLKEVIFLAIADFVMFPNKEHWKSEHVTLDKESLEHDLTGFSFTFLELPKFHNKIDELSTLEEKWMYFFKHAEETSDKDLETMVEHAPIIERAYDELDRFHWNEEEIRTYEQAQKYEWDNNAILALKFDEGLEKGLEKGRQEKDAALKKAKEENDAALKKAEEEKDAAIEKAKQLEKIKMAKTMFSNGIDTNTIAHITGFSKEEIEKLFS